MDTSDDRVDARHTGDGLDPKVDRPRPSITDRRTGTRVITAGPILHATAAAELRRVAKALLAHSDHPLLIDLTAVRYAEFAASVVLRDLAYEAGDADVDLRVVLDPAAHEVTRAVLDDETLFEIYPDLATALPHTANAAGPPPAPTPVALSLGHSAEHRPAAVSLEPSLHYRARSSSAPGSWS